MKRTTIGLISLGMLLSVFALFLPTTTDAHRTDWSEPQDTQRRIATPLPTVNPSPIVLPPACCGKKPPLKDIPNYSSSTYSAFTGQIAIATNFADTATKPSVVIWDLKNQATAPLGSQWDSTDSPATNYYYHPDWTRAKLGNLFGITFDSTGNIYAASSRVYGSNLVGSPSITPGTPGNGDIYKIDANTGAPIRFVQTNPVSTYTSGNMLPNTGPGLGNIHYSCDHDKLYVTNFEDGKIYRIDPATGNMLSTWDHGQNLSSPIADDQQNGFTQIGRRPWAVQVYRGELFYSIWSEDQSRAGNPPNEIWSIALNAAGDFVAPATKRITLPPMASTTYSNPVADISFNSSGRMLVAERTMTGDASVGAHSSRALEYTLALGVWQPQPVNKFLIGFSAGTNSAGGADYDNGPNGRAWVTGDALILSGPTRLYGLQGNPVAGGTAANSILIDLDNDISAVDKQWIGDVEIPCHQCDPSPPKPTIAGPTCAQPGQYCVRQAQGVSYSWSVTGGTPSTGSGSCMNITWGSTAPKSITVTATNAAGCTSSTTLVLNECPPVLDPCCPPWNKDLLKDMMFYRGSGSISAPYTLEFVPTASFSNQMQAYINYLHSINAAFTGITIDFRLHTQGTGNTPSPPYGPQIPATAYVTWNWNSTGIGNPTINPAGFFTVPPTPPFPMVVGTWYMVHTGIYLENGQTFFPDKCSNVEIYVRVQYMSLMRNQRPVLEISDGKKIIHRIEITPGGAERQ
jgi:hypothetical protein